jgi:hypothetical protein
MNEIYKLFVNTIYGALSSRFFSIGNVVLANNITARGRVGVWMLSKALRLRQSITDGGIYEPWRVACWKGPRPGLATLADMYEWAEKGRRGYTSLAGKGWKELIAHQAVPADVDALALAHVREFWRPYGLPFPFAKVTHKLENTFSRAAYMMKADYAMDRMGYHDPKYPARNFVLRGKDRDNRPKDARQHPSFARLGNLLDGSDVFPADMTYTKGGLLSIPQWLHNQRLDVGPVLKALLPGDQLPERVWTQRYNNVHMRLDTLADWKRRVGRRKVSHGQPVPLFERYGPGGTAKVHNAMLNDRLGRDVQTKRRQPASVQ